MYKRRMPTGTPLKRLSQVIVAACRKISRRVPADEGLLYEVSDKVDPQPKLAHTGDFSFLDKAAIITESYFEEVTAEAGSSWKLCTVTQVEELKILLRLLPIWATSISVSSTYAQMNTTFIQQGSAMNMSILSVSVPPASMASFEVVCIFTWVMLYSKVIVPALRGFSSGSDGEPSLLKRMGAGRLLMALAMAVSGLVEMMRLESAARGEQITIAWQLLQYFLLAGAEVFCYIAQLEFFYAEAPDTMKSTCTVHVAGAAHHRAGKLHVLVHLRRRGRVHGYGGQPRVDLRQPQSGTPRLLGHGRHVHTQLRRLQRLRQELQAQDRALVT